MTAADSEETIAPAVRAMRIVAVSAGLVVAGLALFIMVSRLAYPMDAEWMVGSVRDTVERVRDEKPIYAPPSAEFISFLYPPLYYWTSGLFAHVMSTFAACKLVSLGAMGAALWGISVLARRLGASRFWTAMAMLLHVGTYSLTLYFFDLERVDCFAASFILVGVVVLTGEGTWRNVLGGALLGASFFAKQPGLAAFVAALVGLVLAGERRRARIAAVAGGAVFLALFGYLEITTHGWFRYYCIKLPGTHGVEPKLISTFLIEDVPRAFALVGASIAMIAPAVARVLRRKPLRDAYSWQEVVFIVVLGGTMTSAFLLRAHRGGWSNVILAWTPLACIATAVVASRLEKRAAGSPVATSMAAVALGGVTLQLLAGLYDPTDFAPSAADRHAAWVLEQSVRALEAQGEVVVTPTGNITQKRHYHSAALFDVLRANDPAPADYLRGLTEHRYAALFVGAPDEYNCDYPTCRELSDATIRNYFVAGRMQERKSTGAVGFDGKARFILRPRKTPLLSQPRKEVEARLLAEAVIADRRRLAADPREIPGVWDDIEALAASQVP